MATDATLTKTERNAVLQFIVGHQFELSEFAWIQETIQETPYPTSVYRRDVLIHRPTEYYFRFGGKVYEFSPGQKHKIDTKRRPDDSNNRFYLVSKWLERLRLEYDAPDLWAIALEDRKFLQAASGPEGTNTKFTADERTYIFARLDAIRDFVLDSVDLANEQRELIAAQFEYVKEATNRLGRTDWKAVLVGAFFAIVVAATVTPDSARQLWHMIAEAFTPLFTKLLG